MYFIFAKGKPKYFFSIGSHIQYISKSHIVSKKEKNASGKRDLMKIYMHEPYKHLAIFFLVLCLENERRSILRNGLLNEYRNFLYTYDSYEYRIFCESNKLFFCLGRIDLLKHLLFIEKYNKKKKKISVV